MKGEVLFEKMTGISEEYITEAALVPAAGASPAQKPEGRFAALSRVLNSGWGVACICFIVAIAAVVGMVAWGRMGESAGPGGNPHTQFTFSYSMTPINGKVNRGDTVTVDASMTNQGKAFTTSDFFPYAQFILQGNDSVVIQGVHALNESTENRKIENGDHTSRYFIFSIPENAVEGTYDLVISYKKEQQVYSGVLKVDTDHTAPEYSFGYKPVKQHYYIGETVTMEAWVINNQEFLYQGELYGFKPTPACLEHRQSGYRIQGITSAWDGYTTTIIPAGTKGLAEYQFSLLTGVPTGEYDLILAYEDCEQRFERVLTVGESTSETNTPEGQQFSFDYERLNSPDPAYAAWKAGDTIRIKVSVTNQGAPFEYTGSSGDFIPYPELYLKTVDDTMLTLHGTTSLPEDMGTFTVSTGQTGTAVYEFLLSDDIPAGYLEFAMSYADKGTGKYGFGYISNASYTMEEAITFASEQLSERYPELDLSQYAPRCVDYLGSGFDYKVQFQHLYYGYTVIGGETVTVSLTADKQLSGIEIEDEYIDYMAVLTEEIFLSAIENVRNGIMEVDQTADVNEVIASSLSFQIDDEGYLCLTMEYIGPPRYDENGNNLSGCIDHEHYFFTERLCSKP